MISVNNVSLQLGQRKLFSGVNIVFSPGNCYGLIGANGSGKSTFLRILSGESDSTAGEVVIAPGKRVSTLRQDQFAFDEYTALTTVIMGHKKLYEIMLAKDAIYAKTPFTDEDGMRAAELEGEFTELQGWSAESDAAKLLSELGIEETLHTAHMKQLEAGQKVRILLAQALFANPDILLLDEPTNYLDVESSMWLEEFLCDFENTAIVVSHDRHFLDKVCTHIADIDSGKIHVYPGNYTFWSEASQLAARQRSESNKKIEERRTELKEFIMRFAGNASKSRQATSRKKILEKLTIEDIEPSSRKYPYINFEQERESGNDLLSIDNLFKAVDGQGMFERLNITIHKGDKIAFVGPNDLAKTILFQILMNESPADSGTFKWGVSTTRAYYPRDNSAFFSQKLTVVDWLRQYSANTEQEFIRAFLGRMLFSGEESLKPVNVLSGGEKARCMLARMMVSQPNVLILDEPTNHLDLEAITSLNRGLEKFRGTILFSSHDHQLVQTIANRIIEITPQGYIDRVDTTFDEYLSNEQIKQQRHELYATTH
ncbi:MAG: ABC transporter ATP-binding protein [Omnitrophica WOR_2 bacterium GWF2_43_52]|nr:MAG: ABC transporter ATP-binding protein [Omnitrophica WOR_2 bacterium GWA2_44_7]OGX17269.1 MAG: ABC transporter ATP-binding protein [Omnitrophica WOR_2 bacterium GWC2_44_8]OGX22748.1 MAG: ABC transporter ATP-binding protein [Omnitrophica WOR_2 bacterium GWF2_43_52]OGX55807.1 MAG: ABC transporter ATP-binding protein [Omnitrophica WOR_2 bacterium RIFOXYC2_FULL_43_9]HAH19563.1 ABC transporter ATP-binding protein [Candidatus Omnitrophota bacterium]